MPIYEYYCEANGKTVEVYHSILLRLRTWGEICCLTNREPGKTSAETPVVRLVSKIMPMFEKFKGIDKEQPSKRLEL